MLYSTVLFQKCRKVKLFCIFIVEGIQAGSLATGVGNVPLRKLYDIYFIIFSGATIFKPYRAHIISIGKTGWRTLKHQVGSQLAKESFRINDMQIQKKLGNFSLQELGQ